jgi:hypothetical protein
VLLSADHVEPLLDAVADTYYISADALTAAVRDHTSLNLIHLQSGMKIDLFPLSDDPLDVRQISGRQRVTVSEGVDIWIGAPVDQVLRKLSWFRLGGEVSDRQWRDIVSILRVQGSGLDRVELQRVADSLDLGDLCRRAIAAVGTDLDGTMA